MKVGNLELESSTDEQLMELYKKGKQPAFELIYNRHAGRVLNYMRKKLRNDKNAQDLTQEVFLKLHRSREQYDSNLALAPWIFSITRSVFLDFVKKTSLEDATPAEKFDQLPANIEAPGVIAKQTESAELLAGLPDMQKRVVALRVFDEATFDEIAKRLSTSPENARQLFSRGVRKLKASLGGKET